MKSMTEKQVEELDEIVWNGMYNRLKAWLAENEGRYPQVKRDTFHDVIDCEETELAEWVQEQKEAKVEYDKANRKKK